ncbi:MAG: PocR ligand-binding domain-containing protein [Candidatus Humimicrobiaceae bacterium]
MTNLINFKDIAELSIMVNFCRLFSSITGLMIDINDISGNHPKKYYTIHEENIFCRIIHSSKIGQEKCIQGGKERGLKASILRKPDIHKCHAGLTDVYLPILLRDQHIATLCTGQFLTSKPTKKKFELIKANVENYDIDLKLLEDAYFKTRVISKKHIRDYIELMNLIVSYIFEVEDKIVFFKCASLSDRVSKAILYIENNYNKKIYIKDAADYTCLSKYHFEHIFKKETGLTFVDYLNFYRISQAKKYLMGKSVLTVCFDTGFNSVSNFYKIFKRYTGTSPRGYKNNLNYLTNN